MRISDWSSDVCSSDLVHLAFEDFGQAVERQVDAVIGDAALREIVGADAFRAVARADHRAARARAFGVQALAFGLVERSEEHTSELQSLMSISYAVFCLKKKTKTTLKKQSSRLHKYIITEHYYANWK